MTNVAKKTSESTLKKSEETQQGQSRLDVHHPIESLRREVDRLFENFHAGNFHLPFAHKSPDVLPLWRRRLIGTGLPAVDIAEKEASFELTAELPGIDEKNIEIKLSNGNMIIRGEKKEEIEEKKNDYYLSERHYGSFERIFNLPQDVDVEKIDACFSKGVLTISMPKRPEAIKPEKIIAIKTS